MALGISAALASPCVAQGDRAKGQQNRPPRQEQKRQNPPRTQQQPPRQERQQQRPPERQAQREADRNGNRPPQANSGRPYGDARTNNNPNRPPSAYTQPPRSFNSLNPQEKQRALENYRNYQKLPPAQRQQIQDAQRNWNGLSPQQRNHIKNDLMPQWRQLPPQRQRAIQQRLGVLKNMPESARNQHLNDPNFTRGMSEEDKAMLRDLSHMHVGGAPEPPSE